MQEVQAIKQARGSGPAARGLKGAIGRAEIPNLIPLTSSWLILLLIVSQLLFVFYMTFVPGLPTDPGWTLKHWTNVMHTRMLTKVIPNTVVVGFGTILVATFFALPLAWLLNRTSLPFRNTFITLMAVAVIVPGFLKAMGWIMLLNERIGLVNKAIGALLGIARIPLSVTDNPWGIGWVMGLMLTPTMFFLVSGPMRALDPALEEAAEVAGNSEWSITWRVSLPLIWPAILAGIIYTFMTAISVFEVPALLGAASGKVPVLATELFYAVRPSGPDVADLAYGAGGVYGLLIALPSLVALYFYLRSLTQARRYEVITGKAYRPRDIDLGPLKWLGLGFVGLYLLLAVILPLLVLFWASVLPYLQMPSAEALSKVSLVNYRDLLAAIGGMSILWNTVILTVSVALLVLFFSLMVSWVVVRTPTRFAKTMDIIAMLPHAIPGLAFAFALAMLAIFVAKWFPSVPFQGTLGIIVLANVITKIAYGTRITNAALVQVQADLEECAQLCGARNLTVIFRVLMPLIKPSLVFAGLWTCLLTFREVTLTLFLAESHNRVLAVSIWQLWQSGNVGTAAAGGVIMVLVMSVMVFAMLKLAGGILIEQRRVGLTNVRG